MSRFAGGRPIVVAHRGGAAEAPENTIAAFERVIRLGYPGVEFDVRMSKDGVPVVVHDATIMGGARRVAVADVAAADSGLPALDQVLRLPWGTVFLMVEVKPTARDRDLGAATARALVARGLAGQACVASFAADVLRGASSAERTLPLMGLLDRDTEAASFEGIDLFAWGVDLAMVERARVLAWKKGGREVWTWTVKDLPGFERARAAGVDGYITDIPGAVLRAV